MTTRTRGTRHSKARPVPYCRVLPPDAFNDTILQPLPVYSESFITIAQTASCKMLLTITDEVTTLEQRNKHEQPKPVPRRRRN